MINDGCWKNKDLQFRVFAYLFVGCVHIRSRGIFPLEENGKVLQASFASKFCKQVFGCQSRIGCGGDIWSSRWLQAHHKYPQIGYSKFNHSIYDQIVLKIKMKKFLLLSLFQNTTRSQWIYRSFHQALRWRIIFRHKDMYFFSYLLFYAKRPSSICI